MKKTVITRIKGGLGNQLFCYAAARRLAHVNNANLIIDDVSGFSRDYIYRRKYALDHFNITCRKASFSERIMFIGRAQRGIMRVLSKNKPFAERLYVEQEGRAFDLRILELDKEGIIYLDGYWQSEGYFKDVEQIIRDDLKIIPPSDAENHRLASQLRSTTSVSLHVRWFDPVASKSLHNISREYYHCAIDIIEKKLESPHYFVFSDDPVKASEMLALSSNRATFVTHNCGDKNAYADLWLMSQCQHYITANSTFSWWGAWLGGNHGKIVITPDIVVDGIAAWGFDGLIPEDWYRV